MKRILAMVISVALVATMAITGSIAYLQDTASDVNVMTLGNVYIEQNEYERIDGTKGVIDGNIKEFQDGHGAFPYTGKVDENGHSNGGFDWTNVEWDNKSGDKYMSLFTSANNVIDKFVTVENTGEADAYVRTWFAVEVGSNQEKLITDKFSTVFNLLEWDFEWFETPALIEGSYYIIGCATFKGFAEGEGEMDGILSAGETTNPSLMQAYLNSIVTNDDVNELGDTWEILVFSQAIQAAGFADANTAFAASFGVATIDNHPWQEGIEADEDSADLYITTADALRKFAEDVNNGNTYKDKIVKLGANIDLNNRAWTPIGPNADETDKKFYGTFDGQGYTISNLKVDQGAAYHAAGLFGALNGTVKNLKINGATINSISSSSEINGLTDNGTAVVAGSIYTSGKIDNVHVTNATVNGNRYVGGISGYTYGSVTNCSVSNSTLTATPDNLTGSYDNGDKVGGIAGAYWDESVYVLSGNKVNNITVKGYRDIGGIVGAATADSVTNNVANGVVLIIDQTTGYYGDKDENKGVIIGRVLTGALNNENNSGEETVLVADQAELEAALDNDATSIILSTGNYTLPTLKGDELTFVGAGDDTVIDFNKTVNAGDASVTFKNMKFQGVNSNKMSGFGIQHTTGTITYENCTFVDAVTSEFYGDVVYKNCTFTGTYYITTYAVDSATFENCVFDRTDSRAVLVYSHGDNPVKVSLTGCTFKADAQGKTGTGDWTAAVEVDTSNIPTAGTTVTINNCTSDDNYNGIVRDKSTAGKANAEITVNGVIK